MAGLVEKAKKNNVKLVFPVDYITGDKFDKEAKVRSLEFYQRHAPDCKLTGREGIGF